jgi:hypothetical protein
MLTIRPEELILILLLSKDKRAKPGNLKNKLKPFNAGIKSLRATLTAGIFTGGF